MLKKYSSILAHNYIICVIYPFFIVFQQIKGLESKRKDLFVKTNRKFEMRKVFGLVCCLAFILGACSKDETQDDMHTPDVDRQIIIDYIDDNNITAIETNSGLFYEILDAGYGVRPNVNSNVTVTYKGYFTSGSIFDQTSSPVTFGLSGLILGWQEGIPLIKKGGKIKLLVPSHLAYGSRGSGSVPPNTVLIFEIDLIDVL